MNYSLIPHLSPIAKFHINLHSYIFFHPPQHFTTKFYIFLYALNFPLNFRIFQYFYLFAELFFLPLNYAYPCNNNAATRWWRNIWISNSPIIPSFIYAQITTVCLQLSDCETFNRLSRAEFDSKLVEMIKRFSQQRKTHFPLSKKVRREREHLVIRNSSKETLSCEVNSGDLSLILPASHRDCHKFNWRRLHVIDGREAKR